MKKVAVLLLAAGLVFGAAHKGAQAADIKVSGEWDFNTEWNNIGFAKEKADEFVPCPPALAHAGGHHRVRIPEGYGVL